MGKFARWSAPEGLSLLAAWTREGCGAEEIARRCGVREAVLLGWAQRCPGVEAALRRTGEMADAQVEDALLRRALGYAYTETVEEENGDLRVYDAVAPEEVTAYLYGQGMLPAELTTAKIGLEEYYIGLMGGEVKR